MFHTPGNSNSTNPRGLASASATSVFSSDMCTVCSINQDINHDINQHPRDQDAQFCHLVGARKGLQLQANSPPGRGHGDIFYQKCFHGLRISAPFQCSMDENDEQEFPSQLLIFRYLKFQTFRLKRASPAEFAEPLSTSAGTAFSGLVPGRKCIKTPPKQRHWLVMPSRLHESAKSVIDVIERHENPKIGKV